MNGTLNKVMLIGNLGKDPEIHHFDEGQSVARFPIATTESYTNRQTGERVEKTEWHNIVVRNKLAEICHKYLRKGDKVYVEGKIRTREYTDRDGNRRFITEIIVSDFTFLSPKKQDSLDQPSPYSSGDNPAQDTPSSNPIQNNEEEDDLPF